MRKRKRDQVVDDDGRALDRDKKARPEPAYFTTKCGADSLFEPRVLERIRAIVPAVTQLVWETSKLINLHLLRHMEKKPQPPCPIIDETFIDRAMYLVAAAGARPTRKTNDELHALEATFRDVYALCRPLNFALVNRKHLSCICGSARDQLLTNAKNHVATNFRRRHRLFLLACLLNESTGVQKLSRAIQWRIVDAMYKETTAATPSDTFLTLLTQLSDGDRDRIVGTTTRVRDLLASRGLLPVTKTSLNRKWNQFIPWFWLMQSITGDFKERPRGLRQASLFPEHSYGRKYITITTSGLYDVLRSIGLAKNVDRDTFIKNKRDGWAGALRLKASNDEKSPNADLKLRAIHHNKTVTFDFSVKTDGYGCSVQMKRPQSTSDRNHHTDDETNPHPLSHDVVGQKVTAAFQPIEIAPGTVVLGLDPGRKHLVTAVAGVGRGAPTFRHSNRQFWTEAGYRRRQKKVKAWMAGADNDLAGFLTNTPSSRVTTAVDYVKHLRYVLPRLHEIFAFFGQPRMPKLRWKTHITKFKALDHLCRQLSQGSSQTVVAFGAAGFSSSSRGHAPGPVKAIRERLRQHCRVVDVDEYLSSQVCSKCHQRTLKGKKAVDADGDVDMKTPSTKESRSRKARLAYGVKVCNNPKCFTSAHGDQAARPTVLNRDINAARNILHIFLHMNAHDGQRPTVFDRGRVTQDPHSLGPHQATRSK